MTKQATTSLAKLLGILNDGKYHDGTTMGDALNISRSAIWKGIKKLQSYGIKIESVKGKGYVLLEPIILFDLNTIKQKLLDQKIDIILFNTIGSTTEYLQKQKEIQGVKICIAEQQTKGRGRLGRTWHSPFGKNIYLSCLYPFQKDISELAGLSLVVSLAVAKTLQEVGITQHLNVKWPNDIIYANKKIAGILVDVQAETHGMSYAIIGIGLNVNMLDENEHISQPWVSLQKILNLYIDRNNLCATLINTLVLYLRKFDAHGFSPFVEEWLNLDILRFQIVTIKNLNTQVEGKVLGINEQGHLLLELLDGSVRTFSSGDTSISKK